MSKVIFVGAGPGDPDLITVKGRRALEEADMVVYAGSLVPEVMLSWASETAVLIDSASLTLQEIVEMLVRAVEEGLTVVRLHSGDPAVFGAIGEQIDALEVNGIDYEIIPGVTAAFAAAAALGRELTMPEVSQAVIFARVGGRTPVPAGQEIDNLARSNATLCVYLSVQQVDELDAALKSHYPPQTPAAVVYHASRPDERVFRTTVAQMAQTIKDAGLTKTTIILVGAALAGPSNRSRLYDEEFRHGFRE